STEERQNLRTPKLLAQNRRSLYINPVHLKNMLRQVQSDRSNLAHGWLPFAAFSIRQQFGTQMPQGGHPPHHSITSSARASSVGGKSSPSAFAVYCSFSTSVSCVHHETRCWPPSLSYVAPVRSVLLIVGTARAATSAGPTTRRIGSVARSSSRRLSRSSPRIDAERGVSTKPAAIRLTRIGASSSARLAMRVGNATVAVEAIPKP